MKPKVVSDITPHARIITAELSRSIFNRTYTVMLFTALLTMAVMGYMVSQLYETQKDLKALTTQYEITNIYLSKLKKEK